MAKITFAGAAGEVTGSRHLVEINGKKLLFDCGLFQGHRQDAEAKNRKFLFDPQSLDAVILSHSHVDHCGALPLLVKRGYKGGVYCTPATAELSALLLADSAGLQQKDAEFFNKKHPQTPIQPLYTAEDVELAVPRFMPVKYGMEFSPLPGVTAKFFEAGHILGSAQTLLRWTENGRQRSLVFTGDIGRKNLPLLRDPEPPGAADIYIIESTYGNRLHGDIATAAASLKELITKTVNRGGKVLIPAFALGRVQEIAALLEELHQSGAVGKLAVYVDSPLAAKTTEVFSRYAADLDEGYRKVAGVSDPFGHGWVKYVSSQADSMKLNQIKHPVVIIAPSGMCEGGRILHHLRNNIGDARNTVALVGYQAEGTLGRRLADGQKEVLIFGFPVKVAAEVLMQQEHSAHADWRDTVDYIKALPAPPERVLLVHGEPAAAKALSAKLEQEAGAHTHIAAYGETIEI